MINRRNFLTTLTASAAGIAALPTLDRRGELLAAVGRRPRPFLDGLVRVDKNENPFGPFASARAAITAQMSEAGRYPGAAEAKLVSALAKMHHVEDVNIAMGCGSGEILQLCTQYFTTGTKHLVAAAPTFESCGSFAAQLGHKVVSVPVTKDMKLDLDAMAVAAKGAGLVYLCNPNNPTSTVHGAAAVKAFLAKVRKDSPQTYILVDEAYHEYVDEPTYATMIPETKDKYIIVSRTFSKVFGMAGLRCGYAVGHSDTIGILNKWRLDSDVNQLVAAAAFAALNDKAAIQAEQKRNREVRAYVTKWFTDRKFTVAKSDANFLFIDIKRDVVEVIKKCIEKDIAVGRPFPPLLTHLRISIGLQAEMERALGVLGPILA